MHRAFATTVLLLLTLHISPHLSFYPFSLEASLLSALLLVPMTSSSILPNSARRTEATPDRPPPQPQRRPPAPHLQPPALLRREEGRQNKVSAGIKSTLPASTRERKQRERAGAEAEDVACGW